MTPPSAPDGDQEDPFANVAKWMVLVPGDPKTLWREMLLWPFRIKELCIWGVPEMGVPISSSILVGFSIINQPFWGTPILGNSISLSIGLFARVHSKQPERLQNAHRMSTVVHIFPPGNESTTWRCISASDPVFRL